MNKLLIMKKLIIYIFSKYFKRILFVSFSYEKNQKILNKLRNANKFYTSGEYSSNALDSKLDSSKEIFLNEYER